jgi:hypothetical protein
MSISKPRIAALNCNTSSKTQKMSENQFYRRIPKSLQSGVNIDKNRIGKQTNLFVGNSVNGLDKSIFR